MSAVAGNSLALLLELAKETSSEKRRELLRQVTDVFLTDGNARSSREAAIFDDIVDAVAADMETQVRIELSRKVAASGAPVARTARRLALDEIAVARPVIERSSALSSNDLLDVIALRGDDHMMAVTRRPDISEDVSSALVERGSDHVVASLLENRTARIDRQTFERVADRALTSPVLHAPFVRNKHAPLDLLNSVYLKVEGQLRREIMTRFHGVSPAELEAALETSRQKLSSAYGALPEDFTTANDHITKLTDRAALTPPALVQMLREGKRTAFIIAFAKLADVEFSLAQRLVDGKDLDALAMLCKGAGFDRGLFVTICLMVAGDGFGIGKAEQFGKLYEQVSQQAAQRAIRFWKVRDGAAKAA